MGTEPTARVVITCLKEEAHEVLNRLRDSAIFHFEPLRQQETEEHLRAVQERVARLHFLIESLKPFAEKGGLLSAVEDRRTPVSVAELISTGSRLEEEKLYREVAGIKEQIFHMQNRIQEIDRILSDLEPFAGTVVMAGDFKKGGLKNCTLRLFRAPASRLEEAEFSFSEFLPVVERQKKIFGVLVEFNEESEKIKSFAEQRNIEFIELPADINSEETIKDYFERLNNEKHELVDGLNALNTRLSAYSQYYDRIKLACDYWESELELLKAQDGIYLTERAAFISGWVPVSEVDKLMKLVSRFSYVHADVEEQVEDETRPVRLVNRPAFKPLEFLTSLYGMPRAAELDPTPFFAPWFLFFFGLCLGDAGYGALLMAVSAVLLWKFRLTDMMKTFMFIFFFGGLSSFIVGVLTGSYFALDTAVLPGFLLKFRLVDTLNNPTFLLAISVVIGLLQILQGICLSIYQDIKRENDVYPLVREGGKLIFIIGAAFAVAAFLSGGSLEALSRSGSILLVLGAVMIILFSARKSGGVIKRVFSGLYNLYGMTSYLGDVISYARLMALGLATVLIGMAVNILASLAVEMTGIIIGGIIAAIIFIFGHLFNLIINIVSAFVHSMRLQFVEFFKQFYANGGREFQPLRWKERYVKIAEEEVA